VTDSKILFQQTLKLKITLQSKQSRAQHTEKSHANNSLSNLILILTT